MFAIIYIMRIFKFITKQNFFFLSFPSCCVSLHHAIKYPAYPEWHVPFSTSKKIGLITRNDISIKSSLPASPRVAFEVEIYRFPTRQSSIR